MTAPKKVDYALIGIVITILLQGGGFVWWAAKADTRLSSLEARVAPLAATVEVTARLDERTSSMAKAMERVERKLDTWDETKR
jgi:anti-sigma-K factor RskA